MKLQPLICVKDVEASSKWYQQLLELESGHGGLEYERLNRSGSLVLQLHRWEVEHNHGVLGDKNIKPYGNGVILWFELDNFAETAARAESMKVQVVKEKRMSENLNWELWIKDPDGYILVLTSPLP
jgi:predicted enzyme related to lactoylglutathione lyase